MPSLEGATQWINSTPNIESTPSKPTLIYFWAVSCHVCHQNMPKLASWRNEYGPQGLQMIAIHCPRMKTDVDVEKVKAAVENYGITEPCGIDNRHQIKKAFENEFWPAYFLFDREGKLVRRAAGNTGLAMLEPLIQKMLS
jgi:thiol-disulfide isomerase/thioredoxin